MADFTGGSVTQGAGVAGSVQTAANFRKNVISQADVGREFILSITADSSTLTQAKLNEAIDYLTSTNFTSGNTDGTSAGTIGGLGTADGTAYNPSADTVMFVRYQTTESFAVTDFNANDSTGVTLAVVAEFKPAT